MNTKPLLWLLFILSAVLAGCSTNNPAAKVSQEINLPYQKMNGFAYETKPVLLDSRGLFYWFVSDDMKTVYYEPCIGHFAIGPLKRSRSELIFKIDASYGTPIDLRTGQPAVKSAVIGKTYAAKLEADHIVAVSEME